MQTMSPPQTCGVCGTVNVVAAGRCMACGQPLPGADASGSTAEIGAPRTVGGDTGGRVPAPKFVVRLLLPEGDKRLIEVSSERLRLGSGLDEVGLAGDPRVGSAEGWLWADEGRLWVETAPGSQGIYRRIQGEETLQDGDVVLMGDIAALYERAPDSPRLGDASVLGGAANTPVGRLWFLRRDGSPGPAHDLPAGKTILGRTDGHLNFPHDSRLSRRHLRFYAVEDKVTVEDLDSRNGTYLRVRRKTALDAGDALRVGSAGIQVRSRS